MMTSLIMFREPYNLPLIPVQILWLNLVTDGTAGLALALEPVHKGTINQKPRSQEENIMSKVMLVRIMLVALTMLAITFFVYSREIASGASIERARTMAFVVMCLLQITNLFNSRSFKNSIFKTNPFSNKYVILSFLVSLILTYLTVGTSILRQFFHTVILSTADWLYLLGLSVIIIIVIEIEKFIRKNKNTVY
jgi:Ca2+-transporting ATPase